MATCYNRVGFETSTLFPCNTAAASQGKHTSCCGSNQLCLTNGMCRNVGITEATNFEWLGGCTDKTFRDAACGKYCSADTGMAWQCTESETYCCHTGAIPKYNDRKDRTNLTCCSISDLVFHAANPTVFATAQAATLSAVTLMTPSVLPSGSSTTRPSVISTPSTSPTSSFLDPSSPPASSSPTSPLAIGLGVGLGAAATIALIVGLAFCWRRKAATNSRAKAERYEMMGGIPVEVGGVEKPLELRRSRSPAELFVRPEAAELPGEGLGDKKH